MQKLTVIGLTGLAGVGKDAVADVLVANASFKKLAFADPVRTEIIEAFGVSLLDLTRRETKEHPITALSFKRCAAPGFVDRMREHFALAGRHWTDDTLAAPRSPRQIMQLWGTEYRRHRHEGYWTTKMMHRIIDCRREGYHNIVISDCRMANEVELVRHLYAGQLWRIERPGVTAQPGAHSSETTGSAFNPEVTLCNIGGLDNLETTVLDAFMYSENGSIRYDEGLAPFVVSAITP